MTATLCKFMIQLGRYEELGSGVRKVNHYLPHYATGVGQALFEDGDMFQVIVPLSATKSPVTANDSAQVGEQVSEQVGEQVSEQVKLVLSTCGTAPKTKTELLEILSLSNVYLNYKRHILPLVEKGWLERTLPDKPNSRLQKYRLTPKGKQLLESKIK